MKKELVIELNEDLIVENMTKRSCNILRFSDRTLESSSEFYFMAPTEIQLPPINDADHFLIGVLFIAMSESRDIIVKGEVSSKLIINLTYYVECWTNWLPDLLFKIDIKADQTRKSKVSNNNAISAFSGGVDATHTIWSSLNDKHKYKIEHCIFVQGMDIPLADNDNFTRAFDTAQQTLDDVGIKLIPIRTNFREVCNVLWNYSHACALASCLMLFKNLASSALIGSSSPYEAIHIPWGSNPITDHLLSSGDVEIIYDGAAMNRVEKSKEIASWKKGTENLRVCWQGKQRDRNCGKCEKCLRTMMSFYVTTGKIPDCFPNPQDLSFLKNLKIKKTQTKEEWNKILKCALKYNSDEKTIMQLNRIVKPSLIDIILPQGTKGRDRLQRTKKTIRNRF